MLAQATGIKDAATAAKIEIPEIPADMNMTADQVRFNKMHKGEDNEIVKARYA